MHVILHVSQLGIKRSIKSYCGVGFNIRFITLTMFYCFFYRLAEVGRFELPKIEGDYEAGQLFLHAVFGYRGVVLFPWVARVYDRDFPHNSRHGSRYER